MPQSVGSPPPLGEGARDGCGRQPLRGGKGGRLCRGTRPCHPAGATDCAQYGWGRGGLSANYLSVGFLLSDSSCCLPPPLGVGGGLAGAMAVPSAIAPALGHQKVREIGARRRALAHTAQITRAVVRPTLEPPLCLGGAGGACAVGSRPVPGSMAAVIIWGDGSKL